MKDIASMLNVDANNLIRKRRRICEALGWDNPISKEINSAMTNRRLDNDAVVKSVKCVRCGLRGHWEHECDLLSLDEWASSRPHSQY